MKYTLATDLFYLYNLYNGMVIDFNTVQMID